MAPRTPRAHPRAHSSLWSLQWLTPLATYGLVPLLIALATLAAIVLSPPLLIRQSGTPLVSHFLVQTNGSTLADVLTNLAVQPAHRTLSLPQGNVWVLVDTHAAAGSRPEAGRLLLPTQMLQHTACWPQDASGNVTADIATGAAPTLQLGSGLMGTRVHLAQAVWGQPILCRLELATPTRLTVQYWSPDTLAEAEAYSTRALGLLQGGMLMLAAFIAAIALTLRERPYILLAGWLIGTLRIGLWVLGWDHQWMGYTIAPDVLLVTRKVTLALYYLLSCHLFMAMFHRSLEAGSARRLRRIVNVSGAALSALIAIASAATFPAVIFLTTWLGVGVVAVTLIHGLFHTCTRCQRWHTAGACLALGILVAGITMSALGRPGPLDDVHGPTVLLATCLLITLAAASRLREDRQSGMHQRNDPVAHDTLTPLGFFTLGTTGHFEHLSTNARALLQLARDIEPMTLTWRTIFPEMDWAAVAQATEQGRDTEVERLAGPAQAGSRRFLVRATLAGQRVEGSLQDVTARSDTLRELRLMADSDPLTDALNRQGIEKAMDEAIARLREGQTPAALAFLDLEHLKRINNLFGHITGDALLQSACTRVRYSLTELQRLGRVGNDEFIILFPGMRAAQAQVIAREIVESLNNTPLPVGERSFQIKSAMGVIDIDPGMHPKDAIAAAGRACRQARKQHDDVVTYETGARELAEHLEEQHLFEQLQQATPPRDLSLVMQPIISMRQPLRALNFEALLRARTPEGHPLQTARIIEAAEDNGMVTAIDRWVFTATLDWMARHHLKLGHTHQINVNVSGVSLNDDRFIESLFSILGDQPQYSRNLCVEITEGVALQDLERTRQLMRRLKRMGVRVALDDFGAGYTSFSYLKALPADLIKIDGTLIRGMPDSESDRAIVGSIIKLAHDLGMECIAEWVEDLPTLRALVDMGIDYAQGHILSVARPSSEMLQHDNVLPFIEDPQTRAYITQLARAPAR